MAEKKFCSIWEVNWSKAMPDGAVANAIRRGMLDPACLPLERVKRMGLVATEK